MKLRAGVLATVLVFGAALLLSMMFYLAFTNPELLMISLSLIVIWIFWYLIYDYLKGV